MIASLTAYLQGLPAFLAYFGTSVGMTVLFVVVYVRLTPHREFALIKANNVAASLALGGAVLGFILPLASAMANSVSLVDFMLCAGDRAPREAPGDRRPAGAHCRGRNRGGRVRRRRVARRGRAQRRLDDLVRARP